MRGRGLRGLVPSEHVGGDGESGAQARVVRPAAAQRPGGGGGRGVDRPYAGVAGAERRGAGTEPGARAAAAEPQSFSVVSLR